MSRKIIFVIFLLHFSSLCWGLNFTGSLDFSGQCNTNFLEAGLYEEAQSLVTGEADSLFQAKLNLGIEHNISEKNYSKIDYTLETKSYNKNVSLNSSDHTLGFQFDQRPKKDVALRIKTSLKGHIEPSDIKKFLQGIVLIKGTREFNPNSSLELSFVYDRKRMENSDPRDYFAYMGDSQTNLGASFRYEFRKDIISKLRASLGSKVYEGTASTYLISTFPDLSQGYRQDQTNSINLDFIKVIQENLLTDFSAGYVNNPSNISYYKYSGMSLAASLFGYWRGNRCRLKYNFGRYDYTDRSGIGFSGERLQSSQYAIDLKREIRADVYLNLLWEAIRNSSNNPTNNFNNDSYTFGLLANL